MGKKCIMRTSESQFQFALAASGEGRTSCTRHPKRRRPPMLPALSYKPRILKFQGQMYYSLNSLKGVIWVVVKIMVPFGIPIIVRHLIFRVSKKRTIISTTTHTGDYYRGLL